MSAINGDVSVRVLSFRDLAEYSSVPIRFSGNTKAVFSPDFLSFDEVPVDALTKDYDALEHPTNWAQRFNMSRWLVAVACAGEMLAGGCIVAWNTAGVDMLEGRSDLAVLWDIRVDPAWRGKGVGRLLFDFAESWAVLNGCSELKIETQDINVGACRFYQAMGCAVSEVIPDAYDDCPGEAQVIWRKDLR